MTERAYRAALALSQPGSGGSPAERDNAAQRCREYEARHGQPKAQRRYRPGEYPMQARCVRCGKDFAWHYMAQAMGKSAGCDDFTPRPQLYPEWALCIHCAHAYHVHDIMEDVGRCRRFDPLRRPAPPAYAEPLPWWQLEIRTDSGKPLSPLVQAFRGHLRDIRRAVEASRQHPWVVRVGWCCKVPPETAQRIEAGAVDWTDFPAAETRHVWRPSAETRRAVAAWRRSKSGDDVPAYRRSAAEPRNWCAEFITEAYERARTRQKGSA